MTIEIHAATVFHFGRWTSSTLDWPRIGVSWCSGTNCVRIVFIFHWSGRVCCGSKWRTCNTPNNDESTSAKHAHNFTRLIFKILTCPLLLEVTLCEHLMLFLGNRRHSTFCLTSGGAGVSPGNGIAAVVRHAIFAEKEHNTINVAVHVISD